GMNKIRLRSAVGAYLMVHDVVGEVPLGRGWRDSMWESKISIEVVEELSESTYIVVVAFDAPFAFDYDSEDLVVT
ncbi:hypothetical protein BHE74_00057096, partial [Ensete ventricosum]